MKFPLIWIIIVFCLVFVHCHTAELVQGPNGSWYETGQEVAYPELQVIRSKKDIAFPMELEIQLVTYRKELGTWPYTIEAFIFESKKNKAVIQSLINNGYSDLLFIPQSDTLFIYFRFAKQLKVKYSQGADGYIKTNSIPGVWKYYPTSSGNLKIKEELYIDY